MTDTGIQADGAVVTYMLLVDPITLAFAPRGEFPHCPMWHLVGAVQCAAKVYVTTSEGVELVPCTRDEGHHGSHVHHDRPGLPLLAWLEH